MNLTDIYSTFHSTAAKCLLFLSAHRTFPRIDHILSHKTRLQKSKKIKFISTIFSNHNGMKLKFSIRKNNWIFKSTYLEIEQQALEQPMHTRINQGFPGGTVVENLPANSGDTGSSPGLGRSHMPRSKWAREPQLLSLRVWSLCSATKEATIVIVRGPRWVAPLAATRESPSTEMKTQHSNQSINK